MPGIDPSRLTQCRTCGWYRPVGKPCACFLSLPEDLEDEVPELDEDFDEPARDVRTIARDLRQPGV